MGVGFVKRNESGNYRFSSAGVSNHRRAPAAEVGGARADGAGDVQGSGPAATQGPLAQGPYARRH